MNKFGHFSAAGWRLNKRASQRKRWKKPKKTKKTASASVRSWLSALAAMVTQGGAGGGLGFDECAKYKKPQAGTDPPLLVLLSVHHDHLALGERQLVRVVGHAVVDGFHSLRSLFLERKTHG